MRLRANIGKGAAVVAVLALCVGMGLMVGDADYHATAMGWVPLISVLLVLGAARGYLAFAAGRLKFFEVRELGECQRMQDVRFRVKLDNRSPLVLFYMEAHFFINDSYKNKSSKAMTTLALAPREQHEIGFTARFEHIGCYEAGLDRLVVSDFLGLFTRTLPNERHLEVCVTPRIHRLDGLRFSEEALLENFRQAQTVLADSLDYAFVREYAPGVPLKSVHWKLSTRGQGFMTRLFEMPTNPSVGVVLDFYAPDEDPAVLMELFDTVVEAAFSVGEHARLNGLDVELHYRSVHGEHVVLRSWAPEDFRRIVREMPAMSNEPARAADALDIMRGLVAAAAGCDNLVVCSANTSAQMSALVVQAKLTRRAPLMVAAVPALCIEREREDRVAPLRQLDDHAIRCAVISSAAELRGELCA